MLFFSSGKLFGVYGKMEGAKYRIIQEENLLDAAEDLELGFRFTFQWDNNPIHTARVTVEWFGTKRMYC